MRSRAGVHFIRNISEICNVKVVGKTKNTGVLEEKIIAWKRQWLWKSPGRKKLSKNGWKIMWGVLSSNFQRVPFGITAWITFCNYHQTCFLQLRKEWHQLPVVITTTAWIISCNYKKLPFAITKNCPLQLQKNYFL